jgi:polyisoprenoid-binding protein YceI
MEAHGHKVSRRELAGGSRILVVWALLWGLVACQTSPPKPPATPAAQQPGTGTFEIPPGARQLKVSPDESLLQILVYRGGTMARLGHNHIIASHQLSGVVYLPDDPLATRFDIQVPVNELTVDEPALREAAGADFPSAVPQSARDGTRTNLLSAALLDGANYPTIRLRATDIRAAGDSYDAGVEVTLKDVTQVLRVPVQVQRADGAVVARGEFPLTQSQLGLKPFSAALGALVVLDEMQVRFEVTARE